MPVKLSVRTCHPLVQHPISFDMHSMRNEPIVKSLSCFNAQDLKDIYLIDLAFVNPEMNG